LSGASRDAPCGLFAAFGHDLRSPFALYLDRRWCGSQNFIAYAIVETDPINALAFAMRVAIAQLNTPGGRPAFAYIFKGALAGVILPIHAPGVPAANESDVQENRIVKRCRRIRRSAGRYRAHDENRRDG